MNKDGSLISDMVRTHETPAFLREHQDKKPDVVVMTLRTAGGRIGEALDKYRKIHPEASAPAE